jgi:hypothetical protein
MTAEEDKVEQKRKDLIDFLGQDFTEAYTLLRNYDSRIWEMTQFCFLQFMGSIGAVWTIFSFANGKDAPAILTDQWELVSAILLIVSFLFSLLAVQWILRTRVYLVRQAKYIDNLRRFYFANNPTGFENTTQYYAQPEKQKHFDADSTELHSVYFINLVSGFVLGFGIGLLAHYLGAPVFNSLYLGIAVWVSASAIKIGYSILYLVRKDRKEEKQPA